ncbi:unnamed protein product [Paramecium primaurelia]|uniref:Protein kinase domain-containing protein n=1 Tax=Paramecium primaurelia TaxID=5886 RepID=A0A8S1MIC0_PARPR|nr:unnamed protein product [Paramecium primaurelia]
MIEENNIVHFPSNCTYPRDFKLGSVLNEDKDAKVYQATIYNSQNQENVAIKIYEKINEYEKEFIDWLLQKQHQDSQIIQIQQKNEQNNKTQIMMELGEINLQNYLKQNQNLSCAQRFDIFLQIIDTIKFLHENKYFGREIKSSHFVKVKNRFKLCIFGFKKNHEISQIEIKSLENLIQEIFQGEKLIQRPIEQENISENNHDFQVKDIQTYPKNNDTECQQIIQIPNIQQNQIDQKNQTQQQIPQVQYINYQQNVNSLIDAPTQEFPKRQFILTKLLGDGGEGGVYQATPKNEKFYNKDIAFKIQQKMKDHEIQFIDFLIDYQKNQEQNQFIKSNLIKVYERFISQGQQVLIMELGGKDLFSVLKNKLQIEQKIKICQEISQSIAFLHKQQLIHRDIKPENFIQVGTTFKLIDFGLIKKKEENVRLTKMIGSPLYQAPEIINGSDNYQASVDIWSLGCLFFELFQGEPLFDGKTKGELQQQILNYCKNQQQFHLKINQLQIKQELKTLIKQMIDPFPDKRPNIDYVQKELLPKFSPFPIKNFLQSTPQNNTNFVPSQQEKVENQRNQVFQTTYEIRPIENQDKFQKFNQIPINQGYLQQFQQVQQQGQQHQQIQGQQFQQGQLQLQGQQLQQGQNQLFNNQFQPMQPQVQNQQFLNNQQFQPIAKK